MKPTFAFLAAFFASLRNAGQAVPLPARHQFDIELWETSAEVECSCGWKWGTANMNGRKSCLASARQACASHLIRAGALDEYIHRIEEAA